MTLPVPTFAILSIPRPLTAERDAFCLGLGCSVEDAIVEAAYRSGTPLARWATAVVLLDDERVESERWYTLRPRSDQHLIIKAVPGDPVSIITIVTAVASYAAPGALGLAAGSWAAIGVSAAISIAGALIGMAVAPTPRQSNTVQDKNEPAANSITGVRNQALPYGTIPRIFGRVVSFFPPLAAAPYTELGGGNHQYLRMVFLLGYGPLTISDLKIGTTPLTHFENVTYEIRQGYPDDEPLTLFPFQVREQNLTIELREVNGFSERRSEVSTDEISLDVMFPNGLQRIGDRNQKFNLEVQFEVQYKASTSSTWLPAVLVSDLKNVRVDGDGYFTVRGNTKASLRRTVSLTLPSRGRYDVQIRRITPDDQSDNEGKIKSITIEQSYWSIMRSHRNEHPVNMTGLAYVAIRIRASDQLNGVIDQFSCTAQAILPTWNGSAWIEAETRSPAWAMTEILRGQANARPVDDERINLTEMLAFATYCSDEGITFDAVLDARVSVFELLNDAAGTANSSFTQGAGPYSVVIDNERADVSQHWTTLNTWNYKANKVLAYRPHAVKVRYPDERTQRQWNEIYIYDEGYTSSNATLFETLELPYTSTRRQAYLRGLRAIYTTRLRPEIHSFDADAEHLASTRGDRVHFAHDVPLLSVGSARVTAIGTSGADTTTVTLSMDLPMEGGSSYALQVRPAGGSTLLLPVVTVAGYQSTFTLVTPIATASGPAIPDLATLSLTTTEIADMIVRSVEPTADLGARITLVDYAPAIFDAVRLPVPEFDTQITLPPVVSRAQPPQPTVTSIDSDERVLIVSSDGTLTSRILIGFTISTVGVIAVPDEVQIRYRPADTDGDFLWLPTLPAIAGSVSVMPVEDGDTYEIELRSRLNGVPSDWTGITHTVIGKTNSPPAVDRLYRAGDLLVWPYPDPPVDLAGFLLRSNYGTSDDWSTGRPLHTAVWTAPPFDISALHGEQVIMVKAVDTSGNESDDAATITIDLGDLYTENVIDTQSEAPTFAGTITHGTVSGGVLEADLQDTSTFWGSPEYTFWHSDATLFWADIYHELTYVASWTPASDQLDDALLKLEFTAVGAYTVEYRISTSATFWGTGGSTFWGADADTFWAADAVGEFTTWPGALGPFTTVDESYEVRVVVAGGTVQGSISQLDFVIDVPDIIERFDSVSIAVTTGTRLTLTKSYRAIDNILITRENDGGTGFTARFDDRQANPGANGGPLIKVLSSAGAVVAGTVDVVIKGH